MCPRSEFGIRAWFDKGHRAADFLDGQDVINQSLNQGKFLCRVLQSCQTYREVGTESYGS